MADSDSDSDASYMDSAPPSARSLRSRRSEDTGRLESRILSVDEVPQPPKKITRLPVDLRTIAQMIKRFSKKLEGVDYDSISSIRIMRAALMLQER